MSNKIQFDDANELLSKNHNGKISMSNYLTIGKDAHFVCNICGHEWDTVAHSVIKRGHGCAICSKRHQFYMPTLEFY